MSTPGPNRNRTRLTARTFVVAVAALALLVSGAVAATAAVGVSGISVPGVTKAGKEKPKATAAKKKAAKAKAAKAKAAKAKATKKAATATANKKAKRKAGKTAKRPVGKTVGSGGAARTLAITCTFGTPVVDDGGVSDVSGDGQKDLTQMTPGAPPGCVGFQFDETDAFGNAGGNTIDACALYNTNNDGIADYAICVTVDGSPSGAATIVATRFFTCNQNTSDLDNCKGSTFVNLPAGSCTITAGADPFAGDPAADDSPFDTAIVCQVDRAELASVGGGPPGVG